jgi:ABC-type glycerol-3-phosphate transport system substrate-binding protein
MKSVKRAVLPAFAVIAVTAAAGAAQAATTAPATRPAAPPPTFWSWGASNQGELGDGSYTASVIPVAVKLPSGVTVTGVAGGYQHALAVTSTGEYLPGGTTPKVSSAMATRPVPRCPSRSRSRPA